METETRAVLCGLNLRASKAEYDASMEELSQLAEALGLTVCGRVVQSADAVTQKTFIGSGKVHELLLTVQDAGADVVIFNEQLTPMQMRNLEDALDTEVLDRTAVILEIFSQRARTREAKLQVESARLSWMLPRLAGMRRNLSRQGGGSGRLSNKGAGEEKLELDRRYIEHRISEIGRQLDAIEKERATQRSGRLRSGLQRVSLVGYTNAGKSTLMNALLRASSPDTQEKKQVFEKDMLFATLDTEVRRIQVRGHQPFLLSDTVGFISNLPHALVKAFRSTLEEAKYADILLEVVDCSDPSFERQIRVTQDTLQEIGAGDIPVLYVFNKADLLPDIRIPSVHGDRIYLSAKTGDGIDALLSLLDDALCAGQKEEMVLIPYRMGQLLSRIGTESCSSAPEYLPEGIRVRLRLSPRQEKALLSGGAKILG